MPGNFTNQTVGKMVNHTIKKRIKTKKAKFIRNFQNTSIKGTKKLQTVTKPSKNTQMIIFKYL